MRIEENYPSTSLGLYRISPSLPIGISLNSTTGVISGVALIPQIQQKYEVIYTDKDGNRMITHIIITVSDKNMTEENDEELLRNLVSNDDTEEFLSLFVNDEADVVIDKSYKVNISKLEKPITNFHSFYSLVSQSPSLSPPIITLICDSNQNYQLFGDLKDIYIANIYLNILSLDDSDSGVEILLNGIIKSLENSYLYNVHISIQNMEKNKEVILTCNNNSNNYCSLLSSNIKNSTLFHVGFINDNNIIIRTSSSSSSGNNNNINKIGLLIGNIEDSNCYGCFINSNNDLSIKIENINSQYDFSVGLLVYNSVNSNFLYSFINIDILIYINNNSNQQLEHIMSIFVYTMNGIESKISDCFVLVRNKLLIENIDFSGLIYTNNCNNLDIKDSFVEIHGIMISKENSFITSGFIYNSEGKSISMKDNYIKLYFEDNSYGFDYYLFNYVRKSVLNIKGCLFYINRNTVVDISGANNIIRNIENSFYITPNNKTIESHSITEIYNIKECKILPSKFDVQMSSSYNKDFSTIYNKEMPFFDLSKSQINDITSSVNSNSFLSVDIEFIKLNKILFSNLYENIFTINHNIPETIYNDDNNEELILHHMNITVKYVTDSNIIGRIDNCVLFSEKISDMFVEHIIPLNISKCIDIKSIKDGCKKYDIIVSSNYKITFRICSEYPTTLLPTTTISPTTIPSTTSTPTQTASPTTTTTPTSTTSTTIPETTNPPPIETSSLILELRISNLTIDVSNESEINKILIESIIQLYKDNGIVLRENDIEINRFKERLLLRKRKNDDNTKINVIITIENLLLEELIRISNKISHNNILLYNKLVSIETENENPFKYTEIEIDYYIPTVLPTTPNPTTLSPTTIHPTTAIPTKIQTEENNNNSENVGEVNSGIVALVVIVVVIVILIIVIGLLLQIYKQKYRKKADENDDQSEKKSREEKKLKKMMSREKNKASIEMVRNNPL